ncbi:MAG: VWA domain-containing protein [Pseudomonadota bacterium]
MIPTLAQDSAAEEDTILILDASGSMWGQIDGVNKIVIAKDVVEGLVRSLPAERRLGFVAYGHRRKGDCSDIETLADVGAGRDKVITQLRSLTPTGKTPLTKSVEHAATELNYEKNAATVILVSDGLETCEADPCALARTLEENGLDFTVHVVGFDLTAEERTSLQCIAAETGGEFLAADNADQLSEALTQVAAGATEKTNGDSVQKPVELILKATILPGGPEIQRDVSWKVWNVDESGAATGEPMFTAIDTGYADTTVPPGDYIAEAVWLGWRKGQPGGGEPKQGRLAFTVGGNTKVATVPVDLGIPVTLDAPASTPEGVPFDVTWTGPDTLGAFVQVNALTDGPREKIYGSAAQKARDSYETAALKEGATEAALDTDGDGDFDQDDRATVAIGGPSIAGEYEVRYVLARPRLILARQSITVTDTAYTVSAPAEVPIASKFVVDWTGPLTSGDFITIEKKGVKKAFTPGGGRPRLKQGEPTEITAPAEPGEYEVRYVLANGYTLYPGMQHVVQASQPVKVVNVTANITAPETAVGGSTIIVQLEPPADWENDTISVVEPGAEKTNADARYTLNRIRQDDGAFALRVPAIAGEYELAYFINPGTRVIARKTIEVVQPQATVSAPQTVKAGEAFAVQYSGDGFAGDRVIICPADTPDNKMWQWGLAYGFAAKVGETEGTYTEAQSTRRLVGKPGEYEARYVTGLQNVVIARDAFTVTD